MDSDGVQTRRADSREWGTDVLSGCRFDRVGNTSLFVNGAGRQLLSPGIGPGMNDRHWFDLRDSMLRKAGPDACVFLRIVNRGFVFLTPEDYRHHLNDRTRRLTKAGLAYGFTCSFQDGAVALKSSSDSTYAFGAALLDREDAARELAQYFGA